MLTQSFLPFMEGSQSDCIVTDEDPSSYPEYPRVLHFQSVCVGMETTRAGEWLADLRRLRLYWPFYLDMSQHVYVLARSEPESRAEVPPVLMSQHTIESLSTMEQHKTTEPTRAVEVTAAVKEPSAVEEESAPQEPIKQEEAPPMEPIQNNGQDLKQEIPQEMKHEGKPEIPEPELVMPMLDDEDLFVEEPEIRSPPQRSKAAGNATDTNGRRRKRGKRRPRS